MSKMKSVSEQQYYADLIAALRSEDDEKLKAFARKYAIPEAKDSAGWLKETGQILRHKLRLHLDAFDSNEKEASRKWLKDHGHSESIGLGNPPTRRTNRRQGVWPDAKRTDTKVQKERTGGGSGNNPEGSVGSGEN